jgi:hypothetical protein
VSQCLGQIIEGQQIEDPYHPETMLRVAERMFAENCPFAFGHGFRIAQAAAVLASRAAGP